MIGIDKEAVRYIGKFTQGQQILCLLATQPLYSSSCSEQLDFFHVTRFSQLDLFLQTI